MESHLNAAVSHMPQRREEGLTLASQPLQEGSAWHGGQVLQRLTGVLHEQHCLRVCRSPFCDTLPGTMLALLL